MQHKLITDDPILASYIAQEQQRQQETLSLIASENYAYPAVHEAIDSVLTNKYAEGYPGKRYYAGCQYVDQIELLAQERCKKLFSADHANVQPNAGSAANMAAYLALLKPGDTIMGMSLASGGHLTHGHRVSFSGMLFNSITYDVDPETEQLNYATITRLAEQHRPKLIIAGASAYARTIDFKAFHEIATRVNAYLLADCAHIAGLVATGLHPHPFPFADIITATTHKSLRGPRGGFILCKKEHQKAVDRAVFPMLQGGPFMNAIAAKAVAFHYAQQSSFKTYQEQVLANAQTMARTLASLGYRIVSGGTNTHLFIIDLRPQGLTGIQAEQALATAGIIVSRSTIPFDPAPPTIASGIRLGTLAMTTRGCTEQHAETIASWIHEVLSTPEKAVQVKEAVLKLLTKEVS